MEFSTGGITGIKIERKTKVTVFLRCRRQEASLRQFLFCCKSCSFEGTRRENPKLKCLANGNSTDFAL